MNEATPVTASTHRRADLELTRPAAALHVPSCCRLVLSLVGTPSAAATERPNAGRLVLSADARPSQVERLLDQGARAFLTKPLDVKQLFDLLDTIDAEQQRSDQSSPVIN